MLVAALRCYTVADLHELKVEVLVQAWCVLRNLQAEIICEGRRHKALSSSGDLCPGGPREVGTPH